MEESIKPDKETIQVASPLVDLIQGDASVWSKHLKHIDMEKIQKALDFILHNPNLSESQKLDLLSNSWRINYKSKPPTPQEFLTEKYIGPTAENIYPRISKIFTEFWDEKSACRNLVLFPHQGFGKALINGSAVYVPSGIVPIESLKAGDEVCTPSGKITKVKGVFPQGEREVYRFTFADGRTVVADADHLWKTGKSHNNKKWNKELQINERITPVPCWKVITTKEILDDITKNPKLKYYFPLTKPVAHSDKHNIIPSYPLGALIGNGCFVEDRNVDIVGDDIEVFDRIKEEFEGKFNYTFNAPMKENRTVNYVLLVKQGNGFKEAFENTGLKGLKSGQKFIPHSYLYDSIPNRISLLQGLMDTDGTCSVDGKLSYSTSSKQLAEDVQLLVRGLGGIATIAELKRDRREKEEVEYRVLFNFFEPEFPVFTVARKQARYDEQQNRDVVGHTSPQKLYLRSIEKVENAPATCIAVEDPEHLYLTNDYIVTHNSFLTAVSTLYSITHFALMRRPSAFLGLNSIAVLYWILASFSLGKSQEVLLDNLYNICEGSEYFQREKTFEGMVRKEKEFKNMDTVNNIFWTTASKNGVSAIQFSNNLRVKLVSDPGQILGLNVVNFAISELAFFRDNGWSEDRILGFYTTAKERVETRMKRNFWGRTILDSSPNDLSSAVDQFCWTTAELDPTNYVVKGSIWQHSPDDYSKEKFPVYLGGEGKPPRVLENAQGFSPDEILWVPVDLKQTFTDSVRSSLKNLGGIPQSDSNKLFPDDDKVLSSFIPELKVINRALQADSRDTPSRLLFNQIKDELFTRNGSKYKYYYRPDVPRVFSVDQSITTDWTAVAISHLARRKPKEGEGIESIKDLIYVNDLTLYIAPFGGKINLQAIIEFCIDLIEIGGMNIRYASFDQFQSENGIQHLERYGVPVEKVSVDETMEPYFHLASLVDRGNFKTGKNVILLNNFRSLRVTRRRNSNSLKIDHTSAKGVDENGDVDYNFLTGTVGIGAKDGSDAVTANCVLLQKYLSIDPIALNEVWDEDMIIVTPEMIKKTNDALLSNMGFT